MPFAFFRTYRLPPYAKAWGNGFLKQQEGERAVPKGFDVVIFEKNYSMFLENKQDEMDEIREHQKEYYTWFSPNGAKARSKALYREDVLLELKDGYWKKPIFLEAVAAFIAYAKRERIFIRVTVNELYKRGKIEIIGIGLGFCDEDFEKIIEKYACEPFVGIEDQELTCRVVFDLSREEK